MTDLSSWRHDRDHILTLQNAHADRIEAQYQDDARAHPEHVDIRTVADVRTFYSAKSGGFHNRAILTGDETPLHLERSGFKLADNSLMLCRQPVPLN
ncbi:MAG: hypothetical protein GKR89_10580 [Candidatus Latescibacteria bacterium]|nr:hypothetical protein [Candidatus Latescibacterota bacterium]